MLIQFTSGFGSASHGLGSFKPTLSRRLDIGTISLDRGNNFVDRTLIRFDAFRRVIDIGETCKHFDNLQRFGDRVISWHLDFVLKTFKHGIPKKSANFSHMFFEQMFRAIRWESRVNRGPGPANHFASRARSRCGPQCSADDRHRLLRADLEIVPVVPLSGGYLLRQEQDSRNGSSYRAPSSERRNPFSKALFIIWSAKRGAAPRHSRHEDCYHHQSNQPSPTIPLFLQPNVPRNLGEFECSRSTS